MDAKKLERYRSIGPGTSRSSSRLVAYVRIPNKSPMFDPQWERNGHMEAAVTLMAEWCRAQPLPGARVEVRRLPGRTPLLFVDVPGELPGCVLLYGHLDKQPEFTGWLPGLGPWEPVMRDGKLYGRGGADDGYAVFSSLTAIAALKEQQVRLPRCVVLIEACEESGSVDLPAHLEALGDAHRRALAGRLPGCRVRQLRAGVVHDLAARQPRRHAARARAHRGRALGHGHRHRADAVSGSSSSCWRASRIR